MISPAVQQMTGQAAEPETSGVRMMSPDGTIGQIPEEKVQEALADGFKVMSKQDMAELYNRQEIERRFFEQRFAAKHKPIRRQPAGVRGRR